MTPASMRLLLCAVVLTFATAPSIAGEEPVTGQKLAENYCGQCHATNKSGDSPLAAAPPFREIAKRYPPETMAESFAEGITTGHEDMPEFVFEVDEIGPLIAYFQQLAE